LSQKKKKHEKHKKKVEARVERSSISKARMSVKKVACVQNFFFFLPRMSHLKSIIIKIYKKKQPPNQHYRQ
jgi:hypothetical protein